MTAQWAPPANPGRTPTGSTGPSSTGSARMASFRDTLALLFKARFPVLYVETFEESRVVAEIAAVGGDAARIRTPRPIHTWTATQGLVGGDGSSQGGTQDATKALDAILRKDEPAIYVFQDLHPHLGDGSSRPAEPGIVRRIRDIAASFQTGDAARVLILVSPVLRIPPELEKDITIFDFPLPGEAEIRVLLDDMIATNAAGGRIRVEVDEVGRERLAKAAMGLTVHEAENAFARAMVDDGVLTNDDVRVVLEEKRQTIRKAGLLEFVPARHRPGRRRWPAEPEAMARQAQQLLDGGGRRLRAARPQGGAHDRRARLREVADGQGDRVRMGSAAAAARHRQGLRGPRRLQRAEHAQRNPVRRGDRAVRSVDGRD